MSDPGFNKSFFGNLFVRFQTAIKNTGSGFPAMPGTTGTTTPNTPGQPGMPTWAGIREGRLPLAMLLANDALRMNAQEVSMFLKEAMRLPQEIRLMLLMLAMESSPQELKPTLKQNLRQLIEQNLNQLAIPLEDVQALLGKGTQEATEKLMKLLQSSQLAQATSGQQIAELVSSLGKLSEKIKASPQDSLETLMLLYIPWYPLPMPQKLEMSFETGEGSGEAGEKDVSVVLYLDTASLGRFKIVVAELDPLQVVVKLFHEEIARPFIPRLEAALNEKLAAEGLPGAMFYAEIITPEQRQGTPLAQSAEPRLLAQNDPDKETATAGFKQATRQADHKEITIQAGDRVSLLVLNTAYTVARLIFEADESGRLLQKNR